MRYKCLSCKLILRDLDLEGGKCPSCNSAFNLKEMCRRDHPDCEHTVVDNLAYCPDCGEAMCPLCESHDVEIVSRITGYMSSVEGWNMAKKQELKDRTRVEAGELLNK
jgi:hypothetical protein